MAIAKRVAKENGMEWTPIQNEMMSGDYDNALRVLMAHFEIVDVNEPETKDDETTTFPAGKYYIGDPCYVFSGESWSKLCDETDCFENGEDHPHLFSHRGHKFFGASTAHGDGTFYDSDGYRYGVDAGMLGIVPIALVELEGESIEDIEKYKLGRIHEFKEDFEVGVNELHTFLFGDIIIDTDDEAEDYGEDDYYPDDSDYDDYDDCF
jgi:hypothetical protein